MTSQTLGDKIKAARLDAGFTQERLAPKLGVALATLSRWERGVGKRGIGTEQLYAISSATGKPLSFFLREDVAA